MPISIDDFFTISRKWDQPRSLLMNSGYSGIQWNFIWTKKNKIKFPGKWTDMEIITVI